MKEDNLYKWYGIRKDYVYLIEDFHGHIYYGEILYFDTHYYEIKTIDKKGERNHLHIVREKLVYLKPVDEINEWKKKHKIENEEEE